MLDSAWDIQFLFFDARVYFPPFSGLHPGFFLSEALRPVHSAALKVDDNHLQEPCAAAYERSIITIKASRPPFPQKAETLKIHARTITPHFTYPTANMTSRLVLVIGDLHIPDRAMDIPAKAYTSFNYIREPH